ncbi:MAG: PASTA domain-containing protein [Oligoflexus sp.]|nr:PASTA domain-containing protein [Oligoflexus sp.]
MRIKMKFYTKALLLLSLVLPTQAAVTKRDFETMSFSAKKAPKDKAADDAKNDGLENLELPTVPNLVGQDPKDPQVIKDFLKGTGFTVVVVGREKSDSVPKGAVISQTPIEYSGIKKPVVIRVVISTGK